MTTRRLEGWPQMPSMLTSATSPLAGSVAADDDLRGNLGAWEPYPARRSRAVGVLSGRLSFQSGIRTSIQWSRVTIIWCDRSRLMFGRALGPGLVRASGDPGDPD